MIKEVLSEFKKKTGHDLLLCDFSKGIRTHKGTGERYFNVVLSSRLERSALYVALKKMAEDKDSLISRVEPNGLRRVAIFFDESKLMTKQEKNVFFLGELLKG